ncbi:MAG: tetratricopeptide repeat protein, partial [Bacteroidaceae bacterium]|nr:tetratricopeptide repeat protein [Bacteroidaceae bacterium]
MKIVLRLFFPLLCMLPIVATAQTNSYMNNPMVRVTMETYAAMLRENPQDYTIYYSRGKDYYQYGDYEKALTDLDAAIRYFPRQEASDLSQAYTIRGLIYQMKGDNSLALSDFNEALVLEPTSRFSLISRADLLRDMGDYKHAKEDYQQLLRRDARCQEAYLGLAIIAYKENNMGLCHENMTKAEQSNPTNVDFYMTRGAIYEEMGEWRKAADDYVSAMVYGDNRGSVAALNKLSAVAYEPVVAALTVAIERVDEKGFYYYIRGAIHMNNKHYSASIQDW